MGLKMVSLRGEKMVESTPEGALTTVLPLVTEISKNDRDEKRREKGKGKG
jgi:hypothetical protein